jgi:hypothetical protein
MPAVFISSTSEDLKPYRAAARDAALRAGFRPDMMEYFGVGGTRPPLGECLAKVSASDVVVVLVAHRYGWKPSEPPGDGSKSVTWLECEHAVSPVRLEDALQHPRLVITGDPGAGKTTFLRHIAFKMCDAPTARLPILIRIAELADHIRACRDQHKGPTVAAAPGWLPHWLAARSTEFGWGLDAHFFERKLKDGEAAVLLDGLDEAPNRTEREAMARLLENATPTTNAASW